MVIYSIILFHHFYIHIHTHFLNKELFATDEGIASSSDKISRKLFLLKTNEGMASLDKISQKLDELLKIDKGIASFHEIPQKLDELLEATRINNGQQANSNSNSETSDTKMERYSPAGRCSWNALSSPLVVLKHMQFLIRTLFSSNIYLCIFYTSIRAA